MQETLIQHPTAEPVSLELAIQQIREDPDDVQSDLLLRQIRAARTHVEGFTRHCLVCQVWKATFSLFPAVIELPRLPVKAVNSIQYVDTAGSTQTWAASKYQVDLLTDDRIRICPVYGETWPSVQPGTFNAVTVEFVAGHATPFTTDKGSDVNQLDAVAHTYSNSDLLQVWNTGGDLPDGLSDYTNYYVVNATTDAFELSLTSGGAPVTLVIDGTGTQFAGLIPEPLISAMLLLIGHLWENRELSIMGAMDEIPFSVQNLLMPYASVRF